MAADWLIQIPLSELAALQGLPARMENFEKENAQLRRELEALRRNFSDALVLIGDLRQELRKR
jgi:hypothetical protein